MSIPISDHLSRIQSSPHHLSRDYRPSQSQPLAINKLIIIFLCHRHRQIADIINKVVTSLTRCRLRSYLQSQLLPYLRSSQSRSPSSQTRSSHIYYHVHQKLLSLPSSSSVILVPGLPPLEPWETPSFVHIYGSYPESYDMVVNQFRNIDQADWVFFNTFYELEEEVLN